ncbi:BAG family molecular chaperone regulator 4 [Tripterygium wilfordii]|uniref:BAG family molecular chaperone regulator 4 n=1 Tax=Tripterygium wilfordii TaxID=458696 RepID=UPI0018F816E7|nr:BAG family molecular chaperone regulator 4 [Tripterygium wilfordii]
MNEEELEWEVRPGGMLVQRRDDDSHHQHQNGGDGAVVPPIKINVSHGPAQYELSVPDHSTFGHVKKVLEKITGLQPRKQKLFFRGQEKDDSEHLHEAGVKDKAKILLMEEPASKEKKVEEVKQNVDISEASKEKKAEGVKQNADMSKASEEKKAEEMKQDVDISQARREQNADMSKAFEAVAGVREEVDKISERVAALEVVVNGGTKVADEEFIVSSELLMRQLLKLDTIEAEGEAKMQRKAEVRRVQKFQDTLDDLKVRNSYPVGNTTSVTTQWETFDSGVGSLNPPPPMPSSTTISQDWEQFD